MPLWNDGTTRLRARLRATAPLLQLELRRGPVPTLSFLSVKGNLFKKVQRNPLKPPKGNYKNFSKRKHFICINDELVFPIKNCMCYIWRTSLKRVQQRLLFVTKNALVYIRVIMFFRHKRRLCIHWYDELVWNKCPNWQHARFFKYHFWKFELHPINNWSKLKKIYKYKKEMGSLLDIH